MSESKESAKIKKHFSYLFDRYGFVEHETRHFEDFGNWITLLISDQCRFRFQEDRGEITISASPKWNPPGWESGPWFDLQTVIAYFNQGRFDWDYELGPEDMQFQRLAQILEPYVDQICGLFSNHPLDEYEMDLTQLWATRWAKYLDPP